MSWVPSFLALLSDAVKLLRIFVVVVVVVLFGGGGDGGGASGMESRGELHPIPLPLPFCEAA